jgi:hypothetical protein
MKTKKKARQVPISLLLVIVAVVALGSLSVGFLARPAQTVYFTQSLTTLSMWTTTQIYPMGNYTSTATETWGRVCGNSPWNMTVLTAQCSDMPVPEFNAIGIVAFSALAASLYFLRRRRH